MIHSIPTRVGHLDFIEQKDVFHEKHLVEERLTQILSSPGTIAMTLVSEGSPVAIVGLTILWQGVADAWSITSEKVKATPLSFHKEVISLLDRFSEQLGIHRLQMTVKDGYEEGAKWAEALGFQHEAMLRSYGPDKVSHHMYARVING